jgi:5-methylcytosine-specific restriction endonuclease McrA
MITYDAKKYYLGALCGRGHDFDGSGMSLRYVKNSRGCVECNKEGNRLRHKGAKQERVAVVSGKEKFRLSEKLFLGSLCKRGHDYDGTEMSLRHINNGYCTACDRLHTATYSKENSEAAVKRTKAWQQNNRDRWLQVTQEWRTNNIEKVREQAREWRKSNPESAYALSHRSRLKRKYLIGDSAKIDKHAVASAFEACNHRCVYCGLGSRLSLDHFVPLAKGGKHCLSNLVIACVYCNSSKSDSSPFDWYSKRDSFTVERWDNILEILNRHSVSITKHGANSRET